MNVKHFKFKSKDTLLAAHKRITRTYNHVMSIPRTDTLILDVEDTNSTSFNKKVLDVISEFDCVLQNN